MIPDDFYTYIYYDPSRSNEPFYVGKGQEYRAWNHLTRKDIHPFSHRLKFMRKHKVEPIIGIYAGFDEEFALFLEEELISLIGRKDLGKGPLLNLTNGGETNPGYVRTPEVIAKWKESITNNNIPPAWIGKTHTTESKKKMSNSALGRRSPKKGTKTGPQTEEHRKKNSEAVKAWWATRRTPV